MRLDAGSVLLLLSAFVACVMAPRHRRDDDQTVEVGPVGPFFPVGPNGLCPSQCLADEDVLLCHHADGLSMVQLARCVKYSKHSFVVVELRSTTDICSCFLLDFIRLTAEEKIITFTPSSCSQILIKMCYPLLPERAKSIEYQGLVAGLVLEQKDAGWRKATHRHLSWLWFKINSLQSQASRNRYRALVIKIVRSVYWKKDVGLQVGADRIVPFMLYKDGHLGSLYGGGRKGWYSADDFRPLETAEGSSWVAMKAYKDLLKYEIETKNEQAQIYQIVEPSTVSPFQQGWKRENTSVVYRRFPPVTDAEYVYVATLKPNKKRLGVVLFILCLIVGIAFTALFILICRDRRRFGRRRHAPSKKKSRGFIKKVLSVFGCGDEDGKSARENRLETESSEEPTQQSDKLKPEEIERRLSQPYSQWSPEDFERARDREVDKKKTTGDDSTTELETEKEEEKQVCAKAEPAMGSCSTTQAVGSLKCPRCGVQHPKVSRDKEAKFKEKAAKYYETEAKYKKYTSGKSVSGASKPKQGPMGKVEMWTQVTVFDIIDELKAEHKDRKRLSDAAHGKDKKSLRFSANPEDQTDKERSVDISNKDREIQEISVSDAAQATGVPATDSQSNIQTESAEGIPPETFPQYATDIGDSVTLQTTQPDTSHIPEQSASSGLDAYVTPVDHSGSGNLARGSVSNIPETDASAAQVMEIYADHDAAPETFDNMDTQPPEQVASQEVVAVQEQPPPQEQPPSGHAEEPIDGGDQDSTAKKKKKKKKKKAGEAEGNEKEQEDKPDEAADTGAAEKTGKEKKKKKKGEKSKSKAQEGGEVSSAAEKTGEEDKADTAEKTGKMNKQEKAQAGAESSGGTSEKSDGEHKGGKKKKKKTKEKGKASRRLDRSQSASASSRNNSSSSGSTGRTYIVMDRQAMGIAHSDVSVRHQPSLLRRAPEEDFNILRPSTRTRPSRSTKRHRSAEHMRGGRSRFKNNESSGRINDEGASKSSDYGSVQRNNQQFADHLPADRSPVLNSPPEFRFSPNTLPFIRSPHKVKFDGRREDEETEQSRRLFEAQSRRQSVPSVFDNKDKIRRSKPLRHKMESMNLSTKFEASGIFGHSHGAQRQICLGLHNDDESKTEKRVSGNYAHRRADPEKKTTRPKSGDTKTFQLQASPNTSSKTGYIHNNKINSLQFSEDSRKGRPVCLGYCRTFEKTNTHDEPSPVRLVCLGLHTSPDVTSSTVQDSMNRSKIHPLKKSSPKKSVRGKSLSKSVPDKNIEGQCSTESSPESAPCVIYKTKFSNRYSKMGMHGEAHKYISEANSTGPEHRPENEDTKGRTDRTQNSGSSGQRGHEDAKKKSTALSVGADSVTLRQFSQKVDRGSTTGTSNMDSADTTESRDFNEGACTWYGASPYKRAWYRKQKGYVPMESSPSTSQESPLICLDTEDNGSDMDFRAAFPCLTPGSHSLFPSASEIERFANRLDRVSPTPFPELLSQFQKIEQARVHQGDLAADTNSSQRDVTPQTSGRALTYSFLDPKCSSSIQSYACDNMYEMSTNSPSRTSQSQYTLGPRTPFSPPELLDTSSASCQETTVINESSSNSHTDSDSVSQLVIPSKSSSSSSLSIQESMSSISSEASVMAVPLIRTNRKRTRSCSRNNNLFP